MLDDTQRLMGTVEGVLRAARVTQKNAVLSRKDVTVAPLVNEAIEWARSRHHLAPDVLDWAPEGQPGDQLAVMGDREELFTAISNVFDNAVKYSPKQPQIRVSVVTPDLEHIEIRVRDNGVGIASGELKRVFKRFYRALTPRTAEVKGSGLGLFIVRAIARRHGGDAYAASEGAGRGTTVTIELPRNSR
jgi:signal transduction histidine kinase